MNTLDQQNLSENDITGLIKDILECIEGNDGTLPDVKMLNDQVLTFKIHDKSFRIFVQDMQEVQ